MNATVFEVKHPVSNFYRGLAALIDSNHRLSFATTDDEIIEVSGWLPRGLLQALPKVRMWNEGDWRGTVPWDAMHCVWFVEDEPKRGTFSSGSPKVGIASQRDLVDLLCRRRDYMRTFPQAMGVAA